MKSFIKVSLAIVAVAMLLAVPFAATGLDDSDAASVKDGKAAVYFKSNGNLNTTTINDIFTESYLNDTLSKKAIETLGFCYNDLAAMNDAKISFTEMSVYTSIAADSGNNQMTISKSQDYSMKMTLTGKAHENQPFFDIVNVVGNTDFDNYIGEMKSGDSVSITFEFSYKVYQYVNTNYAAIEKSKLINTTIFMNGDNDFNVKSATVSVTHQATPSDVKTVTLKAESITKSSNTFTYNYPDGASNYKEGTKIKSTTYIDNDVKYSGKYTIGDKSYDYSYFDPDNYKKSDTKYGGSTPVPIADDLTVDKFNVCYYGVVSGTDINVLIPNVNSAYQNNDTLRAKLVTLGTCSEDYSTASSAVRDIHNSMGSVYEQSSSSSESSYILWVIGILCIILVVCFVASIARKN